MILALLLAISFSDLWSRMTRDTSSHAASASGVELFQKKDYPAASASFERAQTLRPSPDAAFNLGTAQVAAGKREEGSTTLEKAMNDSRLREAALYNRGNSALAANAFDYAIRDYVEALKLKPSDAAAKRNLEIALSKRDAARKQQQAGNQQSQGGKKEQQKPEAQPGKQEQKPKSDPNAEALLRSVQQQEQEELARMRRPRGEKPRVGW
ncbi:MAG: hypothetical protein ABI837_15090 [Acidobacteriota bacterium]